MTKFSADSFPEDEPEADVAQQQIPVEFDDPTLDTEYLADRSDADVNPADLIDQAIDVPFPEDDRG